jgi:hypothetical protein
MASTLAIRGPELRVNKRKGKLVATKTTTGRLPKNIISKAPDANKLDGKDSAAFVQTTSAWTRRA